MTVFVSLASYRDPLLDFTVSRALARARQPEELHFGVIDQSPPMTARLQPAALKPARLSYVRIDPEYARGPCWARAIAMSLYDGEDWFFQIDSHMDFDEHWDARLVAQATGLLTGRKGVVLSSYPNPFVFEAGLPVHKPTTDKVLAHVVKPDADFAADHLVLGFEAHPVEQDSPVPGFHVGAGCLFAPGSFVQAFPYDPWFYFHGEEQALAARLFTHGWDIFHVPGLPVFHLYNNSNAGVAPRPMHWDADDDAPRQQNWWQLEQRSRYRLGALLAGEPIGAYGLGRERSLADYARFCGIDYANRTISAVARRPSGAGG